MGGLCAGWRWRHYGAAIFEACTEWHHCRLLVAWLGRFAAIGYCSQHGNPIRRLELRLVFCFWLGALARPFSSLVRAVSDCPPTRRSAQRRDMPSSLMRRFRNSQQHLTAMAVVVCGLTFGSRETRVLMGRSPSRGRIAANDHQWQRNRELCWRGFAPSPVAHQVNLKTSRACSPPCGWPPSWMRPCAPCAVPA
jgi:hypothetical protein